MVLPQQCISRRGMIRRMGAAGGMVMCSAPALDALPAPSGPHVEFNVRAFGARGDGAADDTTAIQTAIAAASAAGGATIAFPSGVYMVSSPLQVLDNVRLCGAGRSSTIHAMKSNQIILSLGKCRGAIIESLRFTGAGRLGVAGRGAIWLTPERGGGPRDCMILNCWIEGVGTCGIVVGQAIGCLISGNHIDGTAEHGIYSSASQGCIFSNNVIRNAGRLGGVSTCVGIKVADTTESTFNANIVESPLTEGILIESGTARCTVVGNVIHDTPQRTIRINDQTSAIQITGNILADAKTEAIRIFGGSGCSVMGNTITSARDTAIAIDGPARDATIIGNTVAAGPANGWAMRIDGSGHFVCGNHIMKCRFGIQVAPSARSIRMVSNQITATERAYSDVEDDSVTIDGHEGVPHQRGRHQ